MRAREQPGSPSASVSSSQRGGEFPWLDTRDGRVAIVVVAPHGGRRQTAPSRGDNVNDLCTAEIAAELAERLDAFALVNHGLDRNQIDLNRISHLAGRVPDFARALREVVDRAAEGGRTPLVLFVHGWNMVLPCCDIGVGLRDLGGRLTGRYPTLSRAAYDGFVGGLMRELEQRDLAHGLGRRYPASGKNNSTQLFSGRHRDHDNADIAHLSALASAGRAEAVQLELGIALRWPNPRRNAFMDAAVAAATTWLADDSNEAASSPRKEWKLPPNPRPGPVPGGLDPGLSLQAVLRDGTGVFVGAEPTGAHAMAARLCLVEPEGAMLLAVGEGPWNGTPGHFRLEGLDCRVDDGGLCEVRYDGPMVRYPSHDAYLDLESGLAGSELVEANIALRFVPSDAGFGPLSGTLVLHGEGGRTTTVDDVAFFDRGGRTAQATGERTRVLVADGEHAGARFEMTNDVRSVDQSKGAAEPGPAAVADAGPWLTDFELSAQAASPAGRLAVASGGEPLFEGEITARVPVWRDLPGGVRIRWTFGMLRVAGKDSFDAGAEGSAKQGAATSETFPNRGLFDRLEVFR